MSEYQLSAGGIAVPREPFVPGSIKPEADYEEFSRLGAKLGLPCPQAHIRLTSVDGDGEVVCDYRDRSRTLNRNYWNWLFKDFAGFICSVSSNGLSLNMASDTTYGAGHLTQKDVNANVLDPNTNNFGYAPLMISGVGVTSSGIVIGTGTAAESFDGHALGTLIAHGTSAGQMTYNAMSLAAPSYNSGSLTWTWVQTRIFNNNSGGTIGVNEIGMYARGPFAGATYLIMRDKLGATVSVVNVGQLTVTYTFTLVFPA